MEIKEAITKAKNKEQIAFKFLLDTYWNDVYAFQLKRTQNENDAEDITIQSFSKAFDKIATYKEDYKFKTWLIRKQKHSFRNTSKDNEDNYFEIVDDSPTPEDKIITEQNLANLLRDIKKLKPHYQKVINLRFFQELSYKEISEELNEPINNVKVKLLRAKKLLAAIITKS